MKTRQRGGWAGRILALGAAFAMCAVGADYKIDRELMNTLADSEEATAPFFVVFAERAQVKQAYRIGNRQARIDFVVQSLQAAANRSQAGARGYLQGLRLPFTPFWIENKIFIPRGTLELARALARRPEVAAILPDVVYTIPRPQAEGGGSTQAVEWGIAKIRADQVWGTTKGAGIVVANIDTGVQYNHPAVVNQYRGKTTSGFTHTGNWKDPSGLCPAAPVTPCDNNNHGTHTMGTMVGYDGGSNQIGVAPEAKWIACKGCATNSCSSSNLISCAQWILAPDGGAVPHIVNNSWGGGSGNSWYRSYVQNWRAAGVFPAFSIGNSGSNCNTAGSPGDYPESVGVGATTSSDLIASFSSRGPSAFGEIKPEIAAPGASVRSSIPTNSYSTFSGTSMASPHTAGAVALIWAAAPGYVGNIGGTEQLLKDTAVKLTTTQACGGIAAGASPNNTFGWGRIDAFAAVSAAGGPINQAPMVTINSPGNGDSFNCPVTVNFTGAASDPEDGGITASIAWADNGTGFGSGGGGVSKSYTCSDAGNRNITAAVNDSQGASDSDTITITIVDQNVPAAPSGLTASVSGSIVALNWIDNANSESGFKVEHRKKGGVWAVLHTLGADVTTDTDNPGKGNWEYRVRSYNATVESDPSNVVTVRIR